MVCGLFLLVFIVVPSTVFRYYEQLTHILLEDVFFPSALEFLSALQYTSRQESESRDMLLWGSESLDEVLERDWNEEELSVDETTEKAKPLHVQVKGNMQVQEVVHWTSNISLLRVDE